MAKVKPKIFAHGSYIGTTGYANHTRAFYRELSKIYDLKVRNFTVGGSWDGHTDESHNGEDYIDNLDKKLLVEQSLWDPDNNLKHHPFYSKYPNNFEHNINIVLNETNHHYFYQNYIGPKIAYNVWETTRQPEDFFNQLNTFDQVWVPSEWQKECTIEQGISRDKVKVVPEAVDGNIFKPNDKATLPDYDDGRFKFLIFGRWDYRKSTKEIIESFLDEFNKDEPIDLIVSIDNPYAKDKFKSTEKRLKHYKLDDPRVKIKHFPTRKEYIKFLQKGHVFLSCARSEGWNLPLIEAMACGTPSIYSNCSAQLEFAEGLGLPVDILSTSLAKKGEYSSFSQEMLEGEFYDPDFSHLKEVMRDAYENYEYHKEQSLIESKIIREKFTWENAAKIAGKELENLLENLPQNKVEISFNLGPKVEVIGYHNKSYKVEFINGSTNEVLHTDTITNNMWTQCNKTYNIPWIIKVNGEVVHVFDLKDKKVKISFESNSIGDTLAWIPQVVEFKRKYNCKVIVSTFYNEWFENLPQYKDIEFIKPGEGCSFYAHFYIGWFRDENGGWKNFNDHPNQVNTIPLIQAATDILNIPYKPLNYGINYKVGKRPIKQKYVCIGPQSTSGLKEWQYESWIKLANSLTQKGYKVVSLSLDGFKGKNIIDKKKLPWDKLFNYIHHADLFIGLGSGLSWINWALGKHTLMINNFVPYGYDVPNNITKVENHSVCNNCWVHENFVFDAGNWDWCPEHEGTDKQHICQKSLTPEVVIDKALTLLGKNKKKSFIWITGGNESYLPMIEVLAKSLLKYSEHKIIVYGFNCDSKINLPNVINKRIDYRPKPKSQSTGEPNLFNKDYSIFFAKYLANLDSLNEKYDNFAWIDGDAFVTENIDNSLRYLDNLKDYPLFMKYFHEDINQWRYYNNIKLEGNYGGELSSIKNIDRNPNNKLIATGFYFYNKKSKPFFNKCLEWNKELNLYDIRIYVDDNAFSEERVANNILWQENKILDLPITWNNYYSSDDEIKISSPYLKQGFDVMYDKNTLETYFIHGPDPSVVPKSAEILNKTFKDYNTTKLMIVAHPDDELIFGGGELIKHGSEYKVVCITNKDNKTRSKEFENVMKALNVSSYEMWNFKDSLYDKISNYDLDLFTKLLSKDWEKIVTHNPIGEYGHPKHKRLFETIKLLTNEFYVFSKNSKKLPQDILNKKLELLKLYKSEQPIIKQILNKNGDWFKSNSDTNYIEYESITKYNKDKDVTPYIACYEK